MNVQDNGIGLSEEVKTRIFSMFKALTLRSNKGGKEGGLYGGVEDNSKQTSGPGLGLSFCKSMVERLGGRIWYDNDVKVGATFHIKFPAKIAQAEDANIQG